MAVCEQTKCVVTTLCDPTTETAVLVVNTLDQDGALIATNAYAGGTAYAGDITTLVPCDTLNPSFEFINPDGSEANDGTDIICVGTKIIETDGTQLDLDGNPIPAGVDAIGPDVNGNYMPLTAGDMHSKAYTWDGTNLLAVEPNSPAIADPTTIPGWPSPPPAAGSQILVQCDEDGVTPLSNICVPPATETCECMWQNWDTVDRRYDSVTGPYLNPVSGEYEFTATYADGSIFRLWVTTTGAPPVSNIGQGRFDWTLATGPGGDTTSYRWTFEGAELITANGCQSQHFIQHVWGDMDVEGVTFGQSSTGGGLGGIYEIPLTLENGAALLPNAANAGVVNAGGGNENGRFNERFNALAGSASGEGWADATTGNPAIAPEDEVQLRIQNFHLYPVDVCTDGKTGEVTYTDSNGNPVDPATVFYTEADLTYAP